MFRIAKPVFAAVLIAAGGMPAFAADYVEPPVVEAPPVYEPVAIRRLVHPRRSRLSLGGLRGCRLHHLRRDCCGDGPGTGSFDSGDLEGAFSLGAGVGYQINNYFRTDLTADYWFDSDFDGSTVGFCGGVACVSTDTSSYSAWVLLANAYADLGT